MVDVVCACACLCRPEQKSPRWTQSSTRRGFTISSPLSCHSLHEWQGQRGTWETEGKWGVGWRRESDGEENHPEAELIRCCDGFVSLSLSHSPHPCLSLCLSLWGCHPLQLKRNKHCSFTFNLSSVEFCFVTLDDKGVKKEVSKSLHSFVCLFLYNLFLFTVVYFWNMFFFNCL